jgi:hypothetical protein
MILNALLYERISVLENIVDSKQTIILINQIMKKKF